MKNRPLGVTLIAIYYLLVASFVLVTIIVMMPELEIWKEFTTINAILTFVVIALYIAIGFGLWSLRKWARYLLIAQLFLSIILSLLHNKPVFALGSVIILAIICYLFLSPACKGAFSK